MSPAFDFAIGTCKVALVLSAEEHSSTLNVPSELISFKECNTQSLNAFFPALVQQEMMKKTHNKSINNGCINKNTLPFSSLKNLNRFNCHSSPKPH